MKRLQPTSASPAPALEDDDLLAEFLLRLPPQPSTLPRVGLVCKRWRRLVTDPKFVRRFRAFHRRTPPLHGFIVDRTSRFVPTQEAPDRLPAARFSWRGWAVHCCRHGLVLCYRGETFASEFMVVDPTTGDRRHHIGVIQHEGAVILASTVVLSAVAAGGRGRDRATATVTDDRRRSFLLVALFAQLGTPTAAEALRLTASVYSSDSGAWDNSSVAAVFPPSPFNTVAIHHPSSLVGDAVYWFLDDGEIVRFDLGTRSLAIIEQRPHPPELHLMWFEFESGSLSWILPAAAGAGDGDDGRFCLAVLSGRSIEFWERPEPELSDADAAAKWVLSRTVQLDKVLPVQFQEDEERMHVQELAISGFDEESNVIFVWTNDGVFMSHIESMQFKKVFGGTLYGCCYIHPYSSV